MIDPKAKLKPYLRLMALVAVLGMVSALLTFGFIALVNGAIAAIWDQAPLATGLDARLFTLLVCTAGGLLVGLLVKPFGDHNAIFSELMQEFGRTGRFNYRHAPGIVVTAFISLIAGARLGPEATLAGTLVAALRAPLFAALFTLVMVQSDTAPVVAVAVLISTLLTAYLRLREVRREAAQVPSDLKSAEKEDVRAAA